VLFGEGGAGGGGGGANLFGVGERGGGVGDLGGGGGDRGGVVAGSVWQPQVLGREPDIGWRSPYEENNYKFCEQTFLNSIHNK